MRVHVINHVEFEGPGYIAEWAAERGHKLSQSFALTEEFPRFDEVDLIVVMGGSMSADDHAGNPWLLAEKRYLNRSIAQGKMVLGVCMGAQIIAEVTGGTVRRNDEREIGWYPVSLTEWGRQDPLFSAFPDGLVVGHWHGDTFDPPAGVAPTVSSAATYNQAFTLLGGRIVGLQFHLEWSAEDLRAVMRACPSDLEEDARWVASAEALEAEAPSRTPACREALFGLLDRMQALAEER